MLQGTKHFIKKAYSIKYFQCLCNKKALFFADTNKMKISEILFFLVSLLFSHSYGDVGCYKAVAMTTSKAAAIFTGKVESLMSSNNDDVTAVVIVKRVFKKSSNLEFINMGGKVKLRILKGRQLVNDRTKNISETRVDVNMNEVVVNCLYGGLNQYVGNGFLKKLRVNDTKIFMVRGKMETSLELEAPPLALKLELLDRISTAVKETEEYRIRVKRILKGEVNDRNQQMTVRVRRQEKQKNCYRRPIRIHHTAIFLAKGSGGDVTMQLIVDPLPLTLRNLDKVNAAVKDMTYKPRPPLLEEPCEKIYCAYGANCVHTSDGRGECQCPTECPPTYTPVCGSDGVTYTNHCIMRMTACRQEKNIRKQHSGECDPRSSKRRHRG